MAKPIDLRRKHSNLHHGHAVGGSTSKTYTSWKGMVQRCTNPKNPSWHQYGGRGIRVCDRWRKFSNFLADMGERLDGHSIDRVDSNGDYEPRNCRWATPQQQAETTNHRQRHVVFQGHVRTVKEWSQATGLKVLTINWRLGQGWPVHEALGARPWGVKHNG